MAENPSPDELVRRVLEGALERTLAFVHGTRIAVKLVPAPDGLPDGVDGVTVTLFCLDGRRPAVLAFPRAVWLAWQQAWDKSVADESEHSERSLMLLFTGALDRWQLLAQPGALPGFPLPGLWRSEARQAWVRTSATYHWYEVSTEKHRAWVGLDSSMHRIGKRLLLEPSFRSQLREEVLGEACGRLGAQRSWHPPARSKLKLSETFVLGPCLLPVFGQGESALVPRFETADSDSQDRVGDLLFLFQFGWDGHSYTVVYRPYVQGDIHDWEGLDRQLAGRLLPFSSLVGRPADPESWQQATSFPPVSEHWLKIHAQHIPQGPVWDIFLPAELLNALSVSGVSPWNWSWLSAGADNLLHVFLQVNDRFRIGPPVGFAERAGLDWSVGWYAQTGQSSPPPAGMTVADLLAQAPAKDKVLLIQNVLVATPKLQPLQGLFTWAEEDPEAGWVSFQLAGFDRAGFRTLLPQAALEDWDNSGLTGQSREELRDRNTEALEIIWEAWRRGRLELSEPSVDLLRLGFAQVRKAWRERRARERTAAGIGPVMANLGSRRDLGAVLQRPGPRSLALALLYDAEGSTHVRRLCTRRFAEEFEVQTGLWNDQFQEDGPDLEVFGEARDRIEAELQPPEG
ncbi:MAG: hypothetical protein WCG80_02475 [Spirochaetales bacterium]